ncbi:MAG: Rrf2 family transcriptional regulator [Bacteroidota bacterium]|jgi:Rrf2 family protein|nr:Rrf2 family transcriptional regulator [Bacteroidota bacterium]
MQISKSAGYAVHGLGYLITRGSNEPVQISEIAEDQDVSKTYLAKIFQQLSTARIVVGHRGVTGGYILAREPKDITLVDVIEAVDGPIIRRHCCLGMFGCTIKNKCAVLEAFSTATERFVDVLQNITMQNIVDDMAKAGAPFLAPKPKAKKK